MKVTIGADASEVSAKIAKRFGHAEFYITYDTENKKYSFAKNEDEDGDDHPHSALDKFIDTGTKVFIVGNIGQHAFERIKKQGVEIYLARNITIEEAIQKFVNNELNLLTEPTVKQSIIHHGGHHEHKNHH